MSAVYAERYHAPIWQPSVLHWLLTLFVVGFVIIGLARTIPAPSEPIAVSAEQEGGTQRLRISLAAWASSVEAAVPKKAVEEPLNKAPVNEVSIHEEPAQVKPKVPQLATNVEAEPDVTPTKKSVVASRPSQARKKNHAVEPLKNEVYSTQSKPVTRPQSPEKPSLSQTQALNQTAVFNAPSASTSSSDNGVLQAKAEALDYRAQVVQQLARYKRYPLSARRRGQVGTVEVEFTINPDGTIAHVKIVGPAKYDALNRATVDLLKRASPLPKVPESLLARGGVFRYQLPIRYHLN